MPFPHTCCRLLKIPLACDGLPSCQCSSSHTSLTTKQHPPRPPERERVFVCVVDPHRLTLQALLPLMILYHLSLHKQCTAVCCCLLRRRRDAAAVVSMETCKANSKKMLNLIPVLYYVTLEMICCYSRKYILLPKGYF